MKTSKTTSLLLVLLIIGLAGCDLIDPDPIDDPNNPSVSEVLENATRAQLQNLISGLEVRHRNSTVGVMDFTGSFGREFYPMYASDPRFMGQWLGIAEGADAETDRSFYQSGQTWSAPYSAIKQANLVIEAVQNTENINQQEKNGFFGVAKTFKAFQYLIPLLTQSQENGIRIDVEDPLNPGPFVPYDEALNQIRSLLDEAQSDLQNAGDNFAFDLTEGHADFSTPSAFINLNRAIDARAAVYDQDWAGAIQSVEAAEPFFELAEGEAVMNKGAYFIYTGPPDAFNPYYYPPNASTSQILMVHPSMVADAEAGDERAENKFFERNGPVSQQELSSRYQDNRFTSNTSPVPWLRNEELILIYAEAKVQRNEGTDLVEALEAINLVRNTWGLNEFISPDQDAIIDQILYERRYSLWGEFGHRWIDAKRYDQLDQIPTDGGKIYSFLARPNAEINWDEFNNDSDDD